MFVCVYARVRLVYRNSIMYTNQFELDGNSISPSPIYICVGVVCL